MLLNEWDRYFALVLNFFVPSLGTLKNESVLSTLIGMFILFFLIKCANHWGRQRNRLFRRSIKALVGTLKCPYDQNINSYFSLDFKTILTKH